MAWFIEYYRQNKTSKHTFYTLGAYSHTHVCVGYGRMPIENFTIYVCMLYVAFNLVLSKTHALDSHSISAMPFFYSVSTFTRKRIKAEEAKKTTK